MQKTITIDGREVKFKASASLVYRYKAQFGKDLLDIIMPFISAIASAQASGEGELDLGAVLGGADGMEIADVYNIIWVMAKTANPDIPEPIDWYDSFDEFPAIEIGQELIDILIPSMITTEKSKKKMMTAIKAQTKK